MSSFFGRDHPPRGEQYRKTTLGKTLGASLDELIKNGKITAELARKILLHFDVGINAHLSRCNARVNFKAAEITKYNEFKKVYTVVFRDMELCGHGTRPINIGELEEVMVIAHPMSTLKKKSVAGDDAEPASPKP